MMRKILTRPFVVHLKDEKFCKKNAVLNVKVGIKGACW
jgi:hypothetical protein